MLELEEHQLREVEQGAKRVMLMER